MGTQANTVPGPQGPTHRFFLDLSSLLHPLRAWKRKEKQVSTERRKVCEVMSLWWLTPPYSGLVPGKAQQGWVDSHCPLQAHTLTKRSPHRCPWSAKNDCQPPHLQRTERCHPPAGRQAELQAADGARQVSGVGGPGLCRGALASRAQHCPGLPGFLLPTPDGLTVLLCFC